MIMDFFDDSLQNEITIFNESLEESVDFNETNDNSVNKCSLPNLDPWTNALLDHCCFHTELTESIKRIHHEYVISSKKALKRKLDDHFDENVERLKLKKLNKEQKCKIEIQLCKCIDLSVRPFIKQCRECSDNFKSNGSSHTMCRFIGWRKLRKEPNLQLKYEFLTKNDITKQDTHVWSLDLFKTIHEKRIFDYFRMIFSMIKQDFEEILSYEDKILNIYLTYTQNNPKSQNYWKRMMSGTRELCDQCDTTIFNGHFFCTLCGFAICLHCFELRKDKKMLRTQTDKTNDPFDWPYCTDKSRHLPTNLKYAQIIPPNNLNEIKEELKNFSKLIVPKLQVFQILDQKDYTWFGDWKFLVLNDPFGPNNYEIFTNEWSNSRTLLIRNVHTHLDSKLWTPESFSNEFGHLEIDLVDCRSHQIVPNVKLSQFWKGFEDTSKRIHDNKRRPSILKLKDWPSSEDFKEIMPTRFDDLMRNIPLREYTTRDGSLNMASSLPNLFCKPDLGPKMYVAYSSAHTPKAGTTNLHVDISDAVNVMLYVGEDESLSDENQVIKILKSINCDKDQMDRCRNGEKIGAIWHLFLPQHADRIRAFLTMTDIERGIKPLPDHDPIHDQSHYINTEMLVRLKEECDVHSYTVVQYLGDAVFIPAGAPHQVRNINSCIKVALDFVTPQGIKECLLLTEQFRRLSKTHTNHEDKLQIKNILYHNIKDCISIFKSNENIFNE